MVFGNEIALEASTQWAVVIAGSSPTNSPDPALRAEILSLSGIALFAITGAAVATKSGNFGNRLLALRGSFREDVFGQDRREWIVEGTIVDEDDMTMAVVSMEASRDAPPSPRRAHQWADADSLAMLGGRDEFSRLTGFAKGSIRARHPDAPDLHLKAGFRDASVDADGSCDRPFLRRDFLSVAVIMLSAPERHLARTQISGAES